MKLLRTLISALCILAGAFSLVGWAVSGVAVDAVEDGTAVVGFTERALASDEVQELLASTVTDDVSAWFADKGLDLDSLGAADTVHDLFRALVESDLFQEIVVEQAEASRAQIADALTDDEREPADLVLVVEADSLIAAQLEDVPVIGVLAGEVDLEPIDVVVMDADSFERARTVYKAMEFLAQYGLWLGLGLIVAGLMISPRRAWFLPKLLLAVGVMALIAWAALTFMGVDAIIALVPGGDEGALRAVLDGALTDETIPVLIDRTLWIGLGALVGAVILGLVARVLTGRR